MSSPSRSAFDDSNNDVESDVLDTILGRITRHEFPSVLPGMQESIDAADAEDLLTWVQKDDAVKIQSYIDQKYKEHREVAFVDEDTCESVFRAKWSRLTYYPLLREWRDQVAQKSGLADAFCVLLGDARLSTEEQKALANALRDVTGMDPAMIGNYVNREWRKVWDATSIFARKRENR